MTPLVTIYCMAYNHEKYIQQTIEGFLNQKTTFPYEIIIHDDASTDRTAEIIRKYAEAHSDVIIPILQTENKYSKGIKILKTYILPKAQGKYIAICEGDDYWCDSKKLQKQVDWMEKHDDYTLCAHNSKYVDCSKGTIDLFNDITQDRDFTFEDILAGGKAGRTVFHTSSILFRREYAIVPDDFVVKGIGDYPRYLYMASCGKVRCFADVMSVYRANVPGSWTNRMTTDIDAQRRAIEHSQNIRRMLDKVDVATNGHYTEYIKKTIRNMECRELYIQGDIKRIKNQYKDIYKDLSVKRKIRLFLQARFPNVMNKYISIRRKM